MNIADNVPDTEPLRRARKIMTYHKALRARGIPWKPQDALPELTDRECIKINEQFDGYSYDEIRKAFPKDYDRR